MHTCFLHQGSEDLEMQKFLKEQERLQKLWRKELSISKEEAQSSYQFMKWCDRLSLILCQDKIPSSQRKLEIQNSPSGETNYIFKTDDGSITVTPWCFKKDRIKVYIEISHLSQVEFKDNNEITEALKNAPRQYKEWILHK